MILGYAAGQRVEGGGWRGKGGQRDRQGKGKGQMGRRGKARDRDGGKAMDGAAEAEPIAASIVSRHELLRLALLPHQLLPLNALGASSAVTGSLNTKYVRSLLSAFQTDMHSLWMLMPPAAAIATRVGGGRAAAAAADAARPPPPVADREPPAELELTSPDAAALPSADDTWRDVRVDAGGSSGTASPAASAPSFPCSVLCLPRRPRPRAAGVGSGAVSARCACTVGRSLSTKLTAEANSGICCSNAFISIGRVA